jgi:hypothetical protein
VAEVERSGIRLAHKKFSGITSLQSYILTYAFLNSLLRMKPT